MSRHKRNPHKSTATEIASARGQMNDGPVDRVPSGQSSRSPQPSVGSIVPYAASFVAVGAATLHLMGWVSYRRFMSMLSLDAQLFSKSVDWFVINGAYAAVDGTGRAFTVLAAQRLWMWATIAVSAVLLCAYFVVEPRRRTIALRIEPAIGWLARHGGGVVWALSPVLAWLVVPLALYVVVVAFVVPVVVARSAGASAAAALVAAADSGCSRPRSEVFKCVTVLRDNKPIVRGLLIDASGRHVAVFDATLKVARVVEIAGAEVRGE